MNTQNITAEIASNALATLAAALEAGNSAALATYLNITARFHKYSWTNCLLIATQRPDAAHVAGFRAWLGFGRHVRKGEKGIAILAPIITKREAEAGQQQQEDSSTAEPANRLVGFRSTYVFDIAQTDGQELPEFATVKGNPAEHLERLKALVGSHSIALDYDASIAPAKGVSRGGRITLMPNLPAAEEFSTLVHELSHEKLHRTDRRAETTKTIRETEAEAVAFVVCHAIGLDTNTAAADYIKLYNGDRATLSASLQFIQSTAAEILTALEVDAEAAA
ncbi:MAG TPA: ArdC family protein [Bryobacteraceae bacterium]|nr:ArdC family protein [Bryobacteraceae bacterium]